MGLMAALPALWLLAQSGADNVESNLISASRSNILYNGIITILFIDTVYIFNVYVWYIMWYGHI